MEDKNKSIFPYINIAALFSFAMGLLYLYADTYKAGYLEEFLLSRNLFSESFVQTVVEGFWFLVHAYKDNFKSIMVFFAFYFGIFGFFWIAFWVLQKKRTFKVLLSLEVLLFFSICIGLAFSLFCNYALKEGSKSAKQLKNQINTESKLKGEGGVLKKTIIFYHGEVNSKSKKIIGYIIADSPNGIGIYAEGKVLFIPMAQVIQISYPSK
jgi:hypothetical protein